MPSAQVIAAIGLLSQVGNSSLFDQPTRASKKTAISDNELAGYLNSDQRLHWALLEGIVVFDEILYDGYAFGRHKMSDRAAAHIGCLRQHGLVPASWPLDVYKQTASKLEVWREKLSENGLGLVARKIPKDNSEEYSETNDAFWDLYEKNYYDDLFESSLKRFSFAESNQSFERAFFYAELANVLGISLLPRPTSAGSVLDMLGRSYSHCAHHLMQKKLENFDALVRPVEISIAFPPLARKMAWLSLHQGRPPIDVALELRHSEKAAAYRQHIANLQAAMRSTEPSIGNLHQLEAEFVDMVKIWNKELVPNEGVTHRTRYLRMEILPAVAAFIIYLATRDWKLSLDVGAAAEIFSGALFKKDSAIAIKDPILWGGEKYIAFVADWYDYKRL